MNPTSVRRLTVLIVAFASTTAATSPAARGGLFANFSYNHYFDLLHGSMSPSTQLQGNTLPVQQTRSLTTTGLFGSVSYAFSDNETTAVYQITCQGQATLQYSTIGESDDNSGVDTFTLTQPATYVATVTDTGSGGTDLSLFPYSPYAYELLGSGTMTHAGTLPAGVSLFILESWNMQNGASTAPANISGTESLSIVFTAVPEPASAAGVAVAAGAAALACGRRRAGAGLNVVVGRGVGGEAFPGSGDPL